MVGRYAERTAAIRLSNMDSAGVAASAFHHVVSHLVNEQFIDEHRSCDHDIPVDDPLRAELWEP